MDPRQRRSRERLTAAVLALAAERPADAISVSELATAAGVNRSTFYEHAPSPLALLVLALRAELDEIRLEHLTDIDAASAGEAMLHVTDAVLAHVERHLEVYRRGLGDQSAGASLHSMLSSHFRESCRSLFERGILRPPSDEEMTTDIAAAFLADGTVGAIEVWVNSAGVPDRAAFMAAYEQSVPAWWPNTEAGFARS